MASMSSITEDHWTTVDRYLTDLLVTPDPGREALKASETAGLPQIAVSPNQGKLLNLIARAQGARRILEIGTLGGYSTIWLARALPADGRLVTLEADPKHAAVARGNVERAGLAHLVDLRVGRGLDTLPQIASERLGPFDLIFIDADKPSTPDYFTWALALSRAGSLIVVDNIVRDGEIVDEKSTDVSVQAMRRFLAQLGRERRVSATAIQIVGSKGYDGMAIAFVETVD